ncbi:hypothetical protein N8071_01100 [bacterium]|nr:hypothetical protein [bacterium]
MTLEIDVVEVGEFRRDVAHYHISEDRVALLKRHLRDDPTRGVNDPQRKNVMVWEFGGFNVRYQFDVFPNRTGLVSLMRMQPIPEPTGQLTRKARETLELATKIKSLLFDWKLPGEEPDDE